MSTPHVRDITETQATISLNAVPESVSLVRDHVRDVLSAWQLESLQDVAVLLASELAGNVVQHVARQPAFTVDLHRREADHQQVVCIEVHDPDSRLPALVDPGPDDTHGRGLRLVEMLSDAWEAAVEPSGKCVRFRLCVDEHH